MRVMLLDCDPDVVFGDGPRCPPRLRGFARALARAGHDVSVLCAAHDGAAAGALPGLRERDLRLPPSEREIDWHFSRVQPDLVLERLGPDAHAGASTAAEAGVLHLYDVEHPAPGPDAFAGSSAVRGATPPALVPGMGAIAASELAAARLRAAHGRRLPVEVVPAGADEACFEEPAPERLARTAQLLQLHARQPCVGFVGPLLRGCGVLTLIAALARLPRETRPRLLLVDDGPERNAALRAAEEARVGLVVCGRVPPAELPAHVAHCDVVLAPGDEGGVAPRALLDAMAMACALVVPATAAAGAVLRDDHDACLVPAGDAGALADALARLLAEPGRRARLGAQARRTARSLHTWDARAAQLMAFARTLAPRVAAAVADGRPVQGASPGYS